MRYRLIKPAWAKDIISGPNVLEGEFTEEYIKSKNAEGFNVYFFPNHNSGPVSGKFLSGKEVDVFNWCYVDMDLKDGVYKDKEDFLKVVANFQLKPSKVIDSGNGIHVYWQVNDLTRQSFMEIQFRLINYFNTDASIWTPLQLMRVPGSVNTKKANEFKKTKIILKTDSQYKPEDFDSVAELSESQKSKISLHLSKLDGTTFMPSLEALDNDDLPEHFKSLLDTDQYVRSLWYAEEGKRSDADWKLAHYLFGKNYHKYDEALPVFMNTKKALSKQNYRREYAYNTVSKVWNERETFSVPSVAERMAMKITKTGGDRIFGPAYFDATVHGWRKGEIMGMIAGSGVGKTTATLDIFYEMMKNNPDSDDVYIFFSLEMPDYSIISRWQALIGNDTNLSNRLYVVANEDINGQPQHINLQKLYKFAKGIESSSGKKIAAIALDHLGALERDIDVSQKPNFGIMGEDLGFGTVRNIPFDVLPGKLKELAKTLNCFFIVQSQTTKERSKNGDVELGLDAAFGSAKFEWFMDYVMTFWQPLRRVEHETDLRVLGWQYAKIREKNTADKIKTLQKKVVSVSLDTGKLRPLYDQEMFEFQEMEQKASALREQAEKKKSQEYSNSDGGFQKLKALVVNGKN